MHTIETMSRRYVPSAEHGSTFARTFRRIGWAALARIERMLERRRSRFALLEMTDAQLKDIGLSRADAEGEARRPLWD